MHVCDFCRRERRRTNEKTLVRALSRRGVPPDDSVLSYVVDALRSNAHRELRLIALRQLHLMLDRAPNDDARLALAQAFETCSIPGLRLFVWFRFIDARKSNRLSLSLSLASVRSFGVAMSV